MKTKIKVSTKIKEKGNLKSISLQSGIYSSIISDFITRCENFIEELIERRQAFTNRYGFIAGLIDGFNSDGTKRLEVSLPDPADLSINQQGGFSLFFWFLCKKQVEGVNRFIIKRGNSLDEVTPSVGILPNGSNLFIKMNSSKHKIENLYSSKKIEVNRMYSVTVTFAIDYSNDLTDISLYLDGLLDSQITVPGEPVHNQGNLYIGKSDSLNYGFIGTVADAMIVPRVLFEDEIQQLHLKCVYNLSSVKNFNTYEVFSDKFERDSLIEKYTHYTGNPTYIIENLQLTNEELRQIVKNFDEDLRKELEADIKKEEAINEQTGIISKLSSFLGSDDSDLTITCKKIAVNSGFIYTVLYLANDMLDELNAKRIISIFDIITETLHFTISIKNLINLADILNAYEPSDGHIKLLKFFKNLKFYVFSIFPELRMNQIQLNNATSSKFDFNPVELHENLISSSQNFKNYFDEDAEKDLTKSTFTIKSLYTRAKSGQRPITGKGYCTSRADEENYLNNQFDDIPERREEFADIEEEKEEDIVIMKEDEKEFVCSDRSDEVVAHQNAFKATSALDFEVHVDHKSPVEIIRQNEKTENIPIDNIVSNTQDIPIIQASPESGKENISAIENKTEQERKEKIVDENHFANSNENVISPIETNNEDVFSNFENKLMVKSSDRGFEDTENIVRIDNLDMDDNQEINEENIDRKDELNVDVEAKFASDWSQGQFELVINHCYDCHKHKTTTRHYEFTFIEKFNEIADSVKFIFPNAKIVGNYTKPEYLSCFDVYLRGVGPRLDEKSRFFIFRRILTKRFPFKTEITDKLIALSLMYGSSVNMENAQNQYFKSYSEILTQPILATHEFPASLSEEAEKEKQLHENQGKNKNDIDPERTKLSCINSGCTCIYVKKDNGPKVCSYHPGVWQFGSYHAYWPEAWTCCEKGWGDPGCVTGPHKGVRLDRRLFLCVNHGEANPITGHPDSACGCFFSNSDQDTNCLFHSGYIKNGYWSCCSANYETIEGCFQTKHANAEWPDEKAKLNFYPKPLSNPGLQNVDNKKSNSVGDLIAKCDFFKSIKPYDNPITKLELLKSKRDKEKDEPRFCVRWACEKVFKSQDNHKRACQCHPGKWDHGSTGTKMEEYMKEVNADPKSIEKTTILWRPHWTCCRGDWNTAGILNISKLGCRFKKHIGPLLFEYQQNPRKYKWPDVRLKIYFPKVVSQKWKNFLEKYTYSVEKVRDVCNKFKSPISSSDLPELCDLLRLYLLVVSENIEYQMKFMDIANQNGSIAYFTANNGIVDKEKFISWWFLPYEKIIEDMPVVNKK